MNLFKKLFGKEKVESKPVKPATSVPVKPATSVEPRVNQPKQTPIQEQVQEKRLKWETQIRELIMELGSENKDMRYSASDELVHIGNAAIPFLIEALLSPNENMQGTAYWVLTQIVPQYNDPRLGPSNTAILEKHLQDPDAQVRRNAAWGLGRIGGRLVTQQLLPYLNDQDPTVRKAVVEAFGMSKNPGPNKIEAILPSLCDMNSSVRKAAVIAAGNLEDPIAIEALQKLKNDDDEEVRQKAEEVLKKIIRISQTTN